MPIRRTFGSLRASPELTDALLCNIRHRRNTTVGFFNQTGRKFSSHFDDWTRDKIVELAADLGIKPSFSIPDILATHILTNETFGVITVPDSLVTHYGMQTASPPDELITPMAREIPVHLLTRLSTRSISPYEFLSERQQTQHAVVPIHTTGEFTLFNKLLESKIYFKATSHMPIAGKTSQTVNFEALTERWNEAVHEQLDDGDASCRIFYKLPEQLERHHKLWLEAQGRRATLVSTMEQRKASVAILSDPHRGSIVLLAITISSLPARRDTLLAEPLAKGKQTLLAPKPVPSQRPSVTPSIQDLFAAGPSKASGAKVDTSRSRKKCASCRDHKCARAKECKGRGRRDLCACTNHPVTKNPRAPR